MRIFRVISIVLLFIFFASLLVHPLNSINQDIGRHIKSGQIIWETKQIYKTNLFSFTEPNTPFINHHWLSEVAFYGLNNALGLKGLILFKTAVILLALGLLLASVYSKTRLWPLAISSLVGFMVFMERIDVRPEIFSYLFLSFFVFAIFKAKNENNYKYSYFVPLVQIFWTNMHIYFAIGPILLLFFTIDRCLGKHKEFKQVATIFLATCIATLLNPNFITGAMTPFNILQHYGYSIVENQNIFFLRDYGISLMAINLFEISLAILILSLVITFRNGRRQIIFEVLSAIFFTIMAGKMIRNFGLYGLTFIPIVALNLSVFKINAKKEVAILISVCVILVSVTIYNIKNNVSLAIPTGAEKGVDFIQQNNIKGPVFNNFDVGSFLIWKLYPEQKVFVDGRPEAYSVNFFDKIYKPMQENPTTWNHYANDVYHINYIFFDHHDITPWAQTFLSFISQDKNWPMVYKDGSVVIFLRQTSQNLPVIQKYQKTLTY